MIGTDYKSPTALIEGRMRALEQGDFSLIYDSYHSESPFLGFFRSKSEYLDFAEQQLKGLVLSEWKILRQRDTDSDDVEILLWMRVGAQDLFELARLIPSDDGWRYHSAQKLTREEYRGSVEKINFADFDQVAQKIRF